MVQSLCLTLSSAKVGRVEMQLGGRYSSTHPNAGNHASNPNISCCWFSTRALGGGGHMWETRGCLCWRSSALARTRRWDDWVWGRRPGAELRVDVGEGMWERALDPKRADLPRTRCRGDHFEFASPDIPRSTLPVRRTRMFAQWGGLHLDCPVLSNRRFSWLRLPDVELLEVTDQVIDLAHASLVVLFEDWLGGPRFPVRGGRRWKETLRVVMGAGLILGRSRRRRQPVREETSQEPILG